MILKLHLLGGSGRVGRALVDSLVAQPIDCLKAIHIYCDSTKVNDVQNNYTNSGETKVKASGYSEFNSSTSSFFSPPHLSDDCKHIILNLRGINNKQQWLNQPLNSLELHTTSCRTLLDSNLWMHPNAEIIHFSSLLCDLIEGPLSLDDICEGQESYRRPYTVSRLHQEMILTANAFQHSISTTFLRMPAVYGFDDDCHSPWVLNSLCKAKLQGQKVEARHPEHIVYLAHKDLLLIWIRSLIDGSSKQRKLRTVNYLRPPMLRMSVSSLATIVQESPFMLSLEDAQRLHITLEGDGDISNSHFDAHLTSLSKAITELLING